ncbi:MAG TPA: SHOCT domain-containing protein [Pseudonocardiaceae bacterium]|jgi:putative membrane protein|nr:SHOCT domain-containing protein [Pseudonocardiaceae bacterium]
MTTTLGTVLLADGPGWGPGWNHGGGPGLWPLIPIAWTLVWLAVIATVVVLLWRRGSGDTRVARSALAERFARGDITEQEYTERLAVLHRSRRRRP